ncbi:unnamed protein product [Alopecurus aequalis]
MEARKFGFGSDMPPFFKFDPTDADIVAYYLLPRALNLHNPYAHAIIVGDPASAPPWEILQKNGHADSKYAFFFGPSTAGGRRSCPRGGVWWANGSEEGTVTLLHSGDGAEVDIRYRRCSLTFRLHHRGPSTGYVMDEYEILWPPLPRTVLSRIKITKKYNNAKWAVVAPATAAEQKVADPEQPGPSYEQDAAAMTSNGEGFTGAQHSALCGGAQHSALRYVLPETEYDDNNNNNYRVSISDQPGASDNYNAAATKSDGEGFTYAQADVFSGGRMVEAAGPYYDPSNFVAECGGDYSNNYGEYQARDAAVMFACDEGFGSEQQAGALCGNSDNES